MVYTNRALTFPLAGLFLVLGFLPATISLAETAPASSVVSEGKEVALEYTLKLDNQKVIDTNVGGEPLRITQGSHQIIPGLENALEGMTIGQTKKVTIQPDAAYGPVDPEAFLELEKNQLPPETHKVGTIVEGKDAQGHVMRPRVSEVKKDTVVLDFNHPLAGKTLYFDVTVLDIK